MKNILIIENDNDDIEKLKKILMTAESTYNVYIALNAQLALSMCQQVDIDLFLIDMKLPDYDGIELACKIRKIEYYKITWIIFLNIVSNRLSDAFTKAHCYDYINTEKFDADAFIETVYALLNPVRTENNNYFK